jgi:signal peptidase II
VSRSARLTLLLYGTALAALALDRITKGWVEATLRDQPPIEVIPKVLRLVYTTNSGGAFGLGQSAPWLFAGATIVVSLVIVAVSFRVTSRLVAVGLGLVLAGALGNLADRALNGPGLTGRVTDFIDIRVWPIFNIADMSIVVGAILLAISTLRPEVHHPVRREEPSPTGPAEG